MIEKSKGIVLHTIKHSDSGIVSHIFTRKHGRLSFIIKGLNRKKNNNKRVYFQILQPLTIEYYYKENRDLCSIKEATPSNSFNNLHFDINRKSIMMFLAEVLYKALKPSGPDEDLYDWLIDTLRLLDNEPGVIPNFHIAFLIGLTRFLGISPANNYDDNNKYFDMQDGIYCSYPPLHGYYMTKEFSLLLNSFLNHSISECKNIPLTGKIRKDFLNNLLVFFSLHIPGFKNTDSLKIYSELFNIPGQ